jgi:hypothetical protein
MFARILKGVVDVAAALVETAPPQRCGVRYLSGYQPDSADLRAGY